MGVMMKKIRDFLLLVLSVLLFLTACSKEEITSDEIAEVKDLKVGVCTGPYGDMFKEAIAPSLEEKGYSVEVIEYNDYVQPNEALANEEINVNLFQHSVYLESFAEDNELEISALTEVPTAGMGVFSYTISTLDEIPNGAQVAIPNDTTNLSRSLRVLQQAGIIKIQEEIDPLTATVNDLVENPKNLEFDLVEASQLPRTLDSTDLAVVNGNFAISAGLDLSTALFNEELIEGYLNVIAVRTEDVEKQFSKDILEVVSSDEFKSVIEDESGIFYTFQKPANY